MNIPDNIRPIIRFILTAFAIYIAWYIIYDYFVAPDGRVDLWLNIALAKSGNIILRFLGYDSTVITGSLGALMCINSIRMLGVGNSCNGLELFILFAGFVICFPGSKRNKWWYILLGILGIHIVNSIRAAALTLNQFYHPQSLNFNHHYTFTMLVYAFIFYLWFIWVNRFAKDNKPPQENSLPVKT